MSCPDPSTGTPVLVLDTTNSRHGREKTNCFVRPLFCEAIVDSGPLATAAGVGGVETRAAALLTASHSSLERQIM